MSSRADGSERYGRLAELFAEARDLEGDELAAFLDRSCAGDPALRQELQELLAFKEARTRFLDSTGLDRRRFEQLIPPMAKALRERTERPRRVGPYRILATLGEGGMGVVYLAEQTEAVSRRVALKVIQVGMNTREVIARFEAERQLLAMMNHPAIARVYDAGATEDGRPYFAMEHVKGLNITEYCDRHRLSVEERLELFVQVCHGVEHAHQQGAIHRDIKPSNILVATSHEGPFAKIIDFGVAKAIHPGVTDKTLYTRLGQAVGTPTYMSPEQAEMTVEEVDRRSDVYSLGVLLYELLVGELPLDLDLRTIALDEILRRIREVEPLTPSRLVARLTAERSREVAQKRRMRGTATRSVLRGDLDWITMKALEKERERRYPTAAALAADVGRHLRGEPVAARRPDPVYRLRKLLRRHRVSAAAVACVLVAFAVGLTVNLVLFRMATVEYQRADERLRTTARALAQARFSVYLANVRFAAESLARGDAPAARSYLEECPEPFRGSWEWRHLRLASDPLEARARGAVTALRGHQGEVRAVAFSADGLSIASGSLDGSVRAWDATTGDFRVLLEDHRGEIDSVAFSRDGGRIASGSRDGLARVGDASSGRLLAKFPHEGSVLAVAFGADGARVVSGSSAGGVRAWDVASGSAARGFDGPPRALRWLALSPDGRRCAAALKDRTDENDPVGIWRAEDGRRVATLEGHPIDVRAIAFRLDGKSIASAAPDGTIGQWDVETGRRLGTLEGHEGAVSSIAYSPDGERLVSASDDGSLRVWDGETAKLIVTLKAGAALRCVAFDPTGNRLVTGSDDGLVRVWESEPASAERMHGAAERRGSD